MSITTKVILLGDGPVFEQARYLFPTPYTPCYKHPSEIPSNESFDIGISAWNTHILHERELSLARVGWINLHPSLLPYGKGRDPYYWAIINKEPFGASLHWMTPKIDDGPVIVQEEIPVELFDTSESLHKKAVHKCLTLLGKLVPSILSNTVPKGTPQDGEYYPTHRREQMLYHRQEGIDNPSKIDLAFLRANITSCNRNIVTKDGLKITLTLERV